MRTVRAIVCVLALAGLSACVAQASAKTPPSSAPSVGVVAEPTIVVTSPPAVPKLNPDPKHPSGDLIEVSMKLQKLTAWRDGRIVFQTLISTGRAGYETPRGHFRILHKTANAWSKKWGVWMPWALNFYGNYFLHQLPHYPNSTTNIGESNLGHPASHGCVRVGIPAAERLFRWARVGTPVWIH